ncbi:hypothetical protein [Staphylococcus sp. Marseille-Q6910]|uniref:hypothetical protein n=1 Tax=Staphylococcus sp. Marseille-Q6910 TaxID=2937990 RepID=UPI00203DA47E|nr:hypothetical protein [Staphylococcus sp. Marseille-Q6910]
MGISWYDFIDFAFYGVPDDLEVNMEPKRIWRLMARNFVNEFEDFKKWNDLFATEESGMANFDFDVYYLEDDIEPLYFQAGGNGGGTHRMILAKVTGVQKIFSKVVTVYKLNNYKKSLYDEVKELEKELRGFIDSSYYFKLDKHTKTIDLKMKYAENSFFGYITKGICNKDEDDYEKITPIYEYMEYIRETLESLKEYEEQLNQYYNIYRFLPLKVLKYFCETQSKISLDHMHVPDRKKQVISAIKMNLAYDYKLK